MASSVKDHARKVLSGILPERKDLLETALTKLTEEHFAEDTQIYRNLFTMCRLVFEKTHSVMTRQMLVDLLAKATSLEKSKSLAYEEEFDFLCELETSESDFLWSLDQLQERVAERATLEALTEGMLIANHGIIDKKGDEVRGHEAARLRVAERLSEIEKQLNLQESPEGDLRTEEREILQEYIKRKQATLSGESRGVLFGISELDSLVGGLQPGELDMIVGFSSSGKTSLGVQLAWWGCVEQGKNVVYLTSETLRPDVANKTLARHSNHPKFGLERGLDSKRLRDGTLSPEEERIFAEVLKDFMRGDDYGRFYLAQVPHKAPLSAIYSQCQRISRSFTIDLIVIDYLALLSSGNRRQTSREEYNDLIKDTKRMATTFNNGRGVPILTPWQTNRDEHTKAVQSGYYTLSSLAETAEATNSSDVIIALLEPKEPGGRFADLRGQVLKNRGGEQAGGLQIKVDYASSFFTTGTSSFALPSIFGV